MEAMTNRGCGQRKVWPMEAMVNGGYDQWRLPIEGIANAGNNH